MYIVKSFDKYYGVIVKSEYEYPNVKTIFKHVDVTIVLEVCDLLNTSYNVGYEHGMQLGI